MNVTRRNTQRPNWRRHVNGIVLLGVMAAVCPGCQKAPQEPAAVTVLRRMPDEAVVGLAIPRPGRALPEWIALLDRLTPEGSAAAGIPAAAERVWTARLGMEPVSSYAEAARALNLDPAAPIGVFIGWAEDAESLPSLPFVPLPPGVHPTDPGRGEAVDRLNQMLSNLNASLRENLPPEEGEAPGPCAIEAAVMFRCQEGAAAGKALGETLRALAPENAAETSRVHGVELRRYGPRLPCYFVTGDTLVIGNSPRMVEGVAARFKAPNPVAYATPDCPPASKDEEVALVRVARLGKALVNTPLGDPLKPLLDGLDGDAPAVVTLHVDGEKLECLFRLDYRSYPKLWQASGEPVPLTHIRVVPGLASGVVDVAATDHFKQRVEALWMAAGNESAGSTEFKQVTGILKRMLGLLGSEATLVMFHPDRTGRAKPGFVLLADVQDPGEADEFLMTMGVAEEPVAFQGEYSFRAFPPGDTAMSGVFCSFVRGKVLLGNDLTGLCAVAATVDGGAEPLLFDQLDPPFPENALLYRAVVLDSTLLPLLFPGDQAETRNPGPQDRLITRIARNSRQIRWLAGMAGAWRYELVTVYLD